MAPLRWFPLVSARKIAKHILSDRPIALRKIDQTRENTPAPSEYLKDDEQPWSSNLEAPDVPNGSISILANDADQGTHDQSSSEKAERKQKRQLESGKRIPPKWTGGPHGQECPMTEPFIADNEPANFPGESPVDPPLDLPSDTPRDVPTDPPVPVPSDVPFEPPGELPPADDREGVPMQRPPVEPGEEPDTPLVPK